MNPLENLPVVESADAGLPGKLELGAFSVSLSVANLDVSRAFYEKLGFVVAGGAPEANYLILKNGETTLGLFHGMFDKNALTFNPGLTNRMERLNRHADIREIQQSLEEAGLELADRVKADSTGPGSVMLMDPDGNPILIDQFF